MGIFNDPLLGPSFKTAAFFKAFSLSREANNSRHDASDARDEAQRPARMIRLCIFAMTAPVSAV